jgi:putative FmdB family regulatory protein
MLSKIEERVNGHGNSQNNDDRRSHMPVYEFLCLNCDKKFTLPMSVSDFEKRKYQCPSCKSKKVEEQFTSVNVVTSKKS